MIAPAVATTTAVFKLAGELVRLDLYNCSLAGPIPASLGECTLLRELHLHFNRLTGEVPASLARCTRLCVLELSANRLSGVADLEGWSALGNLASLDLWNNGFDDPDALKARLVDVLPACRVTAVPTPCHIAVPVG